MSVLISKEIRFKNRAKSVFDAIFLPPQNYRSLTEIAQHYTFKRSVQPPHLPERTPKAVKSQIEVLQHFSNRIGDYGGLTEVFRTHSVPEDLQGSYVKTIAEIGLSYLPTNVSYNVKESPEDMPRNNVARNLLKQAFIWQLEQLKNHKDTSSIGAEMPVIRAIINMAYEDERVQPYMNTVMSVLQGEAERGMEAIFTHENTTGPKQQAEALTRMLGSQIVIDAMLGDSLKHVQVFNALMYPSQIGPRHFGIGGDVRAVAISRLPKLVDGLINTQQLDQNFETLVALAHARIILGGNWVQRYDELETLAKLATTEGVSPQWIHVVKAYIQNTEINKNALADRFGFSGFRNQEDYRYGSVSDEIKTSALLAERYPTIAKLID